MSCRSLFFNACIWLRRNAAKSSPDNVPEGGRCCIAKEVFTSVAEDIGACRLHASDAADDARSVGLGGRRCTNKQDS